MDKFLASTKTCAFVCSGTLVNDLRVFNDKKKKKMMKKKKKMKKKKFNGTQITFDMFCAVKSLKVKLT